MKLAKLLSAAAIATLAVSLGACTSSSSDDPIGGDVIAPVTMEANDLQGATVDLVVGQFLNINTGSLATDSYSGETADDSVAVFIAGESGGSAEMNPGVEGVGVGETEVTMQNSGGGIQDLVFTVNVSE
ncbi:hypothetical protein [Microbacterium sp. NPDC076911]|uniref:hypothetical protein n=1 Tax=Microbacterium sp. NPDC076911 TaxID=3154958 RepID=UPI003416B866